MSITVSFPNRRQIMTSPLEMAELARDVFPVSARVPGAEGEGFDLAQWYRAACSRAMAQAGETPETGSVPPTHLIVRAADEFQATIPWSQLGFSLFQYAGNGRLEFKGQPLRLYVPDGTSACLNVKGVVSLQFLSDATRSTEAEYGFANEISPDQLTKGLKNR